MQNSIRCIELMNCNILASSFTSCIAPKRQKNINISTFQLYRVIKILTVIDLKVAMKIMRVLDIR